MDAEKRLQIVEVVEAVERYIYDNIRNPNDREHRDKHARLTAFVEEARGVLAANPIPPPEPELETIEQTVEENDTVDADGKKKSGKGKKST